MKDRASVVLRRDVLQAILEVVKAGGTPSEELITQAEAVLESEQNLVPALEVSADHLTDADIALLDQIATTDLGEEYNVPRVDKNQYGHMVYLWGEDETKELLIPSLRALGASGQLLKLFEHAVVNGASYINFDDGAPTVKGFALAEDLAEAV